MTPESLKEKSFPAWRLAQYSNTVFANWLIDLPHTEENRALEAIVDGMRRRAIGLRDTDRVRLHDNEIEAILHIHSHLSKRAIEQLTGSRAKGGDTNDN